MIVRPRPSAFGLLFIVRGSVLLAIAPRVLVIVAVSAGVVALHHIAPHRFQGLTPAPFTLLGLALSIFLGFRNNACYERWWEGRRQWGQLVTETRGLMRDALALLPEDEALRRRVAGRAIAFARALRDQLRGTDDAMPADWLPPEEWARIAPLRGRPDAILRAQTAEFAILLGEGRITDILYRLFADRLQAMAGLQAACERLSSTLTPFTYTLLLHRTAWLFCLLLPFGLVAELGMATPVVTAILAYAFFGLDTLGEELEEPFGVSQNSVPLDALVRVIEIAVLEALGEAAPPPLQPVDFILL